MKEEEEEEGGGGRGRRKKRDEEEDVVERVRCSVWFCSPCMSERRHDAFSLWYCEELIIVVMVWHICENEGR